MSIESKDMRPSVPLEPEREAAFVRIMAKLIDKHQLETPDFIKRHIAAFDAYGATELADFWRDALAAYDQAYAMAVAMNRGERHLTVVR